MPITDEDKELIDGIIDDARLCSYSYMSKYDMKFTDCPIVNNCKNYPNGCVGCDTIIRLDLMGRIANAILYEVEKE